jgi:hypothetical protein
VVDKLVANPRIGRPFLPDLSSQERAPPAPRPPQLPDRRLRPQVMVANIRCQQILEDQLRAFSEDQAWVALQEASSSGVVEGFGREAHSLMDSCMQG